VHGGELLVSFLKNQLAAKRYDYPKTALSLLGKEGLDKRGLLSARMRRAVSEVEPVGHASVLVGDLPGLTRFRTTATPLRSRGHTMKRIVPTVILALAVAAASASVAFAGQPTGATGHGAAVSAVAKAVDSVSGKAHGQAVSALAKTHGAAVSATARAQGAANAAAGKAKGAAASEPGRLKGFARQAK